MPAKIHSTQQCGLKIFRKKRKSHPNVIWYYNYYNNIKRKCAQFLSRARQSDKQHIILAHFFFLFSIWYLIPSPKKCFWHSFVVFTATDQCLPSSCSFSSITNCDSCATGQSSTSYTHTYCVLSDVTIDDYQTKWRFSFLSSVWLCLLCDDFEKWKRHTI